MCVCVGTMLCRSQERKTDTVIVNMTSYIFLPPSQCSCELRRNMYSFQAVIFPPQKKPNCLNSHVKYLCRQKYSYYLQFCSRKYIFTYSIHNIVFFCLTTFLFHILVSSFSPWNVERFTYIFFKFRF